MGYVHMDHAGWLQNCIEIEQKRKPNKRERDLLLECKGWHAAPNPLPYFHRRAVNIIGIVGGGIYNCPISWTTAYWGVGGTHNCLIASWWGDRFATFDFNKLTSLVMLAHEARVRAEISGLHVRPGHIMIGLHERRHDRSNSERHPNLDEALAEFRGWFKPDHMINYAPQHDEHLFNWQTHKNHLWREKIAQAKVALELAAGKV